MFNNEYAKKKNIYFICHFSSNPLFLLFYDDAFFSSRDDVLLKMVTNSVRFLKNRIWVSKMVLVPFE